MRQPEHSDAARVRAAELLLDRGWGKAPQAHTGEAGEGAVAITIRHIVEGKRGVARDAKVIEAVPRPVLLNGEGGKN